MQHMESSWHVFATPSQMKEQTVEKCPQPNFLSTLYRPLLYSSPAWKKWAQVTVLRRWAAFSSGNSWSTLNSYAAHVWCHSCASSQYRFGNLPWQDGNLRHDNLPFLLRDRRFLRVLKILCHQITPTWKLLTPLADCRGCVASLRTPQIKATNPWKFAYHAKESLLWKYECAYMCEVCKMKTMRNKSINPLWLLHMCGHMFYPLCNELFTQAHLCTHVFCSQKISMSWMHAIPLPLDLLCVYLLDRLLTWF